MRNQTFFLLGILEEQFPQKYLQLTQYVSNSNFYENITANSTASSYPQSQSRTNEHDRSSDRSHVHVLYALRLHNTRKAGGAVALIDETMLGLSSLAFCRCRGRGDVL